MDGDMDDIGAQIERHFGRLASDFDLTPQPYQAGRRGGRASFSSDNVQLDVNHEAGATPWVTIGRAGGLQFGLHELAAAAGRDGELEEGSEEPSGEVLARLADLTRELAGALLSGDFSAFPALKRARAARKRESNVQMFGTSTGESPRFEGRPTLDALFSDASNDGIREARTYQAVWDYGYSLGEVAEFEDSTEAEVQRRLDRWDGML